MQRSGGQSQISAPLQGPPPRSPELRMITDLVTANPERRHSTAELAKQDGSLLLCAVVPAGPVTIELLDRA